jgi:glycine/D-amino acid oxidase-like deaminating enzyme
MESIWQKELEKPTFASLHGEIKTDVLVIGGGITGILCGYMLKNAGVDCVIAEAKTICDGVTKNTTAKVTYHHGAIFDQMIKRYGQEKTKLYLKANEQALAQYRSMAQTIDCDWEETTSYVYSLTNQRKIEKEVAALDRLGYQAQFTKKLSLPFRTVGAVTVPNQAQFHPLKFLCDLAKDLKIYENTEVLELTKNTAITKHGKIHAKKIIVATHFPFLNKHGLYFLKMYQHRSYVLALKNAPKVQGIYVDESEKGLSFRSYHDLMLLGGGSHRTGKQGGAWNELREVAKEYYPKAQEVCHFATQDCKTLDDIAYIGQYSKKTSDLYVATGYNKWGMTTAMVAAKMLTDLVQEKENEYAAVFSPSRSILHKQLFVNAGESALGLLKPTAPRCSHLGCALKYNKQERTWDCGCHGSRFTEDGRVIDNPATKDIKT